MKAFAKGCDGCGEDRKLKIYPTENGVIELCRECSGRTERGRVHVHPTTEVEKT